MNRKAAGILALSAIGFIVAVMLFYSYADKQRPGGETRYLGATEVNIFNTYIGTEKQLLYIDLIAEQSLNKALEELAPKKEELAERYQDELLAGFRKNFEKRLSDFNNIYNSNLLIEDYELSVGENSVKGISEKELNITTEYIDYRFKPGFRIFY